MLVSTLSAACPQNLNVAFYATWSPSLTNPPSPASRLVYTSKFGRYSPMATVGRLSLMKEASNDFAAELMRRHFAKLIEAITPSLDEIAVKMYSKKIVTDNVLVYGNREIPRERAKRLVNEMHSAVKTNGDTLFQIADILEQHTPANHLASVLRSEFKGKI